MSVKNWARFSWSQHLRGDRREQRLSRGRNKTGRVVHGTTVTGLTTLAGLTEVTVHQSKLATFGVC